VTHEQSLADRADRRVVLHEGRIVKDEVTAA
jgi:predicted ABC-type transport system involved in lysophospholipase L1 biosynthesis ATPase subunit